MTKDKFLEALRSELTAQPKEVDEIISDYEEHFSVGLEKGRTEKEISKSLGDPVKLAKQLGKQHKVEKAVEMAETNPSPNNIFQAILATAALGFFNLVFVIGPAAGVLGVLFGFWISAIAIVISGFMTMIASLISPLSPYIIVGVHPIVGFFVGTGALCLGLLMVIGMFYLTKFVFRITVQYLKFNINLISQKNE